VTWQLALDPVPESVQGLPAKLSFLDPTSLTLPAGVIGAPEAVSVTIAVHVVDCPTASVVWLQLSEVLVERELTCSGVLALLPVWKLSPSNVAVIVCDPDSIGV
jgi:hypothetical protein